MVLEKSGGVGVWMRCPNGHGRCLWDFDDRVGDSPLCPYCGEPLVNVTRESTPLRGVLFDFAFWMSSTWDPSNTDDRAAARAAVTEFMEAFYG